MIDEIKKKKTYAEKLKDPRWQKKRLEVLQRDSFKCWYCGDDKNTLHVHHEMYLGKDPWDTPDECLSTVCEDCHSFYHLKFTELEKFLISCVFNRDGVSEFGSLKKSIRNILDEEGRLNG